MRTSSPNSELASKNTLVIKSIQPSYWPNYVRRFKDYPADKGVVFISLQAKTSCMIYASKQFLGLCFGSRESPQPE